MFLFYVLLLNMPQTCVKSFSQFDCVLNGSRPNPLFVARDFLDPIPNRNWHMKEIELTTIVKTYQIKDSE